MTNLTTHMAELRKILAEIENKPITEAGKAVFDILGLGTKGLSKQGAKTIIKQLGEEVTVNVIRRVGKKKVEQEVELVLKAIPEQDSYLIVSRNGKQSVGEPKLLSAAQVADDVEKAVAAGRKVTLSGELQTRASSELSQQAVRDAENMTDAQLEAAIKDLDRSPALRKEYEQILDQRKASKSGDSESLKREAEMEKKRIAGMKDADLQTLYNNTSATAVSRKAAKEELERRGIKPEAPKAIETPPAKTEPEAPKTEPEAPKTGSEEAANLERARVDYKKLSDSELQTIYNGRDEVFNSWQKQAAKETLESRGIKPGVTKVEPTPTKTADEVAQAKKNAAAEAEAKAAIDAGEVKIKEADLLPAKPGETASDRLKRTLEEKPEIVDKWNSLKGTAGEEGFWQYVKRRKVATLITALTVAAISAGVYTSGEEPKEIDSSENPAEVEIGNVEPEETEELDAGEAAAAAAKKKADADAAKKKADAANSEAGQGASKTDGKETDGKETVGVADNSAEQQALLTQINGLIAELSKSKNTDIQKRLDAVRKKLGQTGQAASVVSKDDSGTASGWYDIGQGYRRWYGKDGVDPTTGRKVTTGTTDITPSDGVRHRDKYADMEPELANLARRNAAAGNPAKTKSN